MTLDDKLRGILDDYVPTLKEQNRLAAQIKTAFANEGYYKTERQRIKPDGLLGDKWVDVMTGQEFYDRFEQIYLAEHTDLEKGPDKIEWTHVLKAVQKAAGLEKGDGDA